MNVEIIFYVGPFMLKIICEKKSWQLYKKNKNGPIFGECMLTEYFMKFNFAKIFLFTLLIISSAGCKKSYVIK